MINLIFEFLEYMIVPVIIMCAVWIFVTWIALAYHNHKHRNE